MLIIDDFSVKLCLKLEKKERNERKKRVRKETNKRPRHYIYISIWAHKLFIFYNKGREIIFDFFFSNFVLSKIYVYLHVRKIDLLNCDVICRPLQRSLCCARNARMRWSSSFLTASGTKARPIKQKTIRKTPNSKDRFKK